MEVDGEDPLVGAAHHHLVCYDLLCAQDDAVLALHSNNCAIQPGLYSYLYNQIYLSVNQ